MISEEFLFYCNNDIGIIKDTNISSDVGWGCMYRTSQMLMFRILAIHLKVGPKYIREWFSDKDYHHYSIHNMLNHGKKYDANPGSWIGSSQAAYIIRDLINEHNIGLNIIISSELLKKDLEITGPSLIMLPRRLGIENIGKYKQDIITLFRRGKLLSDEIFLGFIGGVPRHSLYFFDIKTEDQEPFFLTIDPNIKNYCRKINPKNIDPCMTFAFLIDKDTYIIFKELIKGITFI